MDLLAAIIWSIGGTSWGEQPIGSLLFLRDLLVGPLCRKPRGLLVVGLWTPGSNDTTSFLRVELDGGPENQDEKIDRGVH